jgi:hypothetical protein
MRTHSIAAEDIEFQSWYDSDDMQRSPLPLLATFRNPAQRQ